MTRGASGCLVCTSSGSSWSPALAGPAGPWTWPPLPPSPLAGVLLIWSAYVHFHLWNETDGYRSIPTIGPLFLLQSIAGLVIGVGVMVVRRLWAAVIGLGFAAEHRRRVPVLRGDRPLRFQGLVAGPFRQGGLHDRDTRCGCVRRRRRAVSRENGSPRSRRHYPGRHIDVGTIPIRALRPPFSRWGAGPARAL